jgi:hypothetical protein
MGKLTQMYDDYLSSEEFDLMFDDEYETWLKNQEAQREEYYQAIGDGINQNYCN